MRKLLGIVVLGLFLSGNAYAKYFGEQEFNSALQNNNVGVVVLAAKSEKKAYLRWSYGKFYYGGGETVDEALAKPMKACKQYYESKKKGKYKCYLVEINYVVDGKIKEIWDGTDNLLTYSAALELISKDKNKRKGETLEFNSNITFNISQKKDQCTAIGFEPKSEKFADCVLRLVELDIKNQQTEQMNNTQKEIAKNQNKSESNKFMSNALLNLGQELMQPNSNIYNSNTRNCSVRKSFGNTSTVTCY